MKKKSNKFFLIIICILLIIGIISYNSDFLSNKKIYNSRKVTFNGLSLENDELYVGYGKKKITPLLEHAPIPLSGYGNTQYRTAKLIEGEQEFGLDLYATAIAIGDENDVILLVTLDLGATSNTLRDLVSEYMKNNTNINISKDKIILASTHTHSSPDYTFSKSDYPDLVTNVNNYRQYLIEQISSACQEALSEYRNKPSKVYFGTVNIVNDDGTNALNFVRHYITSSVYKDGTSVVAGSNHGDYAWNSSTNKYVSTSGRSKHTTNADNSLQMIKFDRKTGEDILLVNFQTHPHKMGSSTSSVISSDIVGYFRNIIENDSDFGNMKVAYFSGAGGNVTHNTVLASEKTPETTLGGTVEQLQEKSINYASRLASYVKESIVNDRLMKANINDVKNISKNVELRKMSKEDVSSNLLISANYCQKIWNAPWSDVKKMIEGTYNWNLTSYPVDLDGNIYGPDGKNLAKLIKAYSGTSSILKNYIIIEGNDTDGYTATISDDITRSYLNQLVSLLGANLEERIYSVFHANAIVKNSKISNGTTGKIEVNAVSFGDISFATVPYEMFHENGSYVKNNSPSPMTFVLELANGSNGYFPSEEAFDYGCYEADTASYKKGAAELVSEELVSLLNSITDSYVSIKHYSSDYDYNQISDIELQTDVETYKSYFKLPSGYTLSIDLGNKSYIYTGSTSKIISKDKPRYTFTNIVLGDNNGDGIANSGDLLKIRQHLLNKITLQDGYFIASDLNKDSTINSGDLLRMRQYLLGNYNL